MTQTKSHSPTTTDLPTSDSDPSYPRTHDRLARECTRDPIFLFQERRPVWAGDSSPLEYDHDEECFVDEDGAELTTDQAIKRGAGVWVWNTITVFLTRAEGEDFGKATAHRYPDGWRVYCVAAEGALIDVLAGATEGGRYR